MGTDEDVAGDDDVARTLADWLAARARLDAALGASFARRIPVDLNHLAALHAAEDQAWQGFRRARLTGGAGTGGQG